MSTDHGAGTSVCPDVEECGCPNMEEKLKMQKNTTKYNY